MTKAGITEMMVDIPCGTKASELIEILQKVVNFDENATTCAYDEELHFEICKEKDDENNR